MKWMVYDLRFALYALGCGISLDPRNGHPSILRRQLCAMDCSLFHASPEPLKHPATPVLTFMHTALYAMPIQG
jgi:hypothetical protein